MAVNLEPAPGAAASPLRADRRNAGARQDRWMLEFEKAFMGGDEPGNGPVGKDVRAREDRLTAAPSSAVPVSPHRLAAAAPVAPALHTATTADAPSAHGTDRQAGEFRESDCAEVADEASAAATATATATAIVAAGTSATADTPAAAAYAAVQGGAIPGLAVYGSAGVETLHGQPPGTHAPRIPNPLSNPLSSIISAQGALTADASAPAESGKRAGGRAADTAPYDKNAMHVFVDKQGVHAFIRDAALQTTQLHALMRSMAAEIAAGGRQLATLTVNGRTVLARAAEASAEEDDALLAHEPGGESGPTHPSISQPVSKGHP